MAQDPFVRCAYHQLSAGGLMGGGVLLVGIMAKIDRSFPLALFICAGYATLSFQQSGGRHCNEALIV